MGLAGLGTEGVTPPTGELAQLMQDEATDDQNADIINLYLAGSDLIVGAPPPIQAASTTEPVQSLVFNSNFTRERYGKASVNDKISLESDRTSLLLDSNQSDAQKALSIISSLELSNGLSAVQNMSDGDVTGTTVTNIDSLSSRPDDIFLNTAQLSGPKSDHLALAFTGAPESDFVDAMVRQAGGTTGPTSFSAVVSDQTLMSQIAADAVASAMLTMHPNGQTAFVGSQTARDEFFASQTAIQELTDSPAAIQEVFSSSTAADQLITSDRALYELSQNALISEQIMSFPMTTFETTTRFNTISNTLDNSSLFTRSSYTDDGSDTSRDRTGNNIVLIDSTNQGYRLSITPQYSGGFSSSGAGAVSGEHIYFGGYSSFHDDSNGNDRIVGREFTPI